MAITVEQSDAQPYPERSVERLTAIFESAILSGLTSQKESGVAPVVEELTAVSTDSQQETALPKDEPVKEVVRAMGRAAIRLGKGRAGDGYHRLRRRAHESLAGSYDTLATAVVGEGTEDHSLRNVAVMGLARLATTETVKSLRGRKVAARLGKLISRAQEVVHLNTSHSTSDNSLHEAAQAGPITIPEAVVTHDRPVTQPRGLGPRRVGVRPVRVATPEPVRLSIQKVRLI